MLFFADRNLSNRLLGRVADRQMIEKPLLGANATPINQKQHLLQLRQCIHRWRVLL